MLVGRVLDTSQPLKSLTIIFLAWKALIFLLALVSPGPGYDTSTTLLGADLNDTLSARTPTSPKSLWLNFVRWDAIYFTQMAQRGHLYEQEWAFGIGISNSLAGAAAVLPFVNPQDKLAAVTIGGLLLSHVTHWISVVLVWLIAQCLRRPNIGQRSSIPFVAALLHIISPAGIFLSAPYSEGVFASLNMLGFLIYLSALNRSKTKSDLSGPVLFAIGGVVFGLATVVRSNGILAGLLYAYDACRLCLGILTDRPNVKRLLELGGLIAGGTFVGVGLFIPQYLAYQQYCMDAGLGERRPWCEKRIPDIFTFVQSHYWNVGPFRYWTLSNLPLFLLAAPTLCLLTYSATRAIGGDWTTSKPRTATKALSLFDTSLLMRLALPQLVLAVMALTSYHVQIIARLSSGYPLWYIWLAAQISDGKAISQTGIVVRWMVLYAMIQAGLYASFLPPA